MRISLASRAAAALLAAAGISNAAYYTIDTPGRFLVIFVITAPPDASRRLPTPPH